MQEDLSLTESQNLDDQKLRRLIELWRNKALGGSYEAQGILYAFEAEMMRRRTSCFLSSNDSASD